MANYDLVLYTWTALNDPEWNEIMHPPRSIKLFRRWECLFIMKFDFVITALRHSLWNNNAVSIRLSYQPGRLLFFSRKFSRSVRPIFVRTVPYSCYFITNFIDTYPYLSLMRFFVDIHISYSNLSTFCSHMEALCY